MDLKGAKEFQKKYGIDKVNSKVLQSIIEVQGYRFIEFNGISDTKEVQTLINLLGLQQRVLSSKCFIFQNDHYRLLFIHEELNEEERMIVLAHEEGHIWNNHLIRNGSIYDDVKQEYEANEFAHYLLKDTSSEKRKRRFIVCMFLVVIGVMLGVFFKQKHDAITYTESLYITESGAKYHRKDCVYIRDRKDVHRMTLVEFDTGEYEACEVCFPDDQ